jgi:DNA-binding LytR/AlgR family response regulator
MKIKCVIIDDEQFAIDSLIRYCREIIYIEIVATFIDPYKALSYLEYNTPDLIFVDIQMPEISGMQIAKSIKGKTMFIFTTAHSEYAINGFNLNAVDYLLKPFGFERFLEATDKAKAKFDLQNFSNNQLGKKEYIFIKVEYMNVRIDVYDILYVEALDNYSRIFTQKKTYTTLLNLRRIHSLLPENKFIRIHKSFIIAKDKINHFSRDLVVVEGRELPIGRVYAGNFLLQMAY